MYDGDSLSRKFDADLSLVFTSHKERNLNVEGLSAMAYRKPIESVEKIGRTQDVNSQITRKLREIKTSLN